MPPATYFLIRSFSFLPFFPSFPISPSSLVSQIFNIFPLPSSSITILFLSLSLLSPNFSSHSFLSHTFLCITPVLSSFLIYPLSLSHFSSVLFNFPSPIFSFAFPSFVFNLSPFSLSGLYHLFFSFFFQIFPRVSLNFFLGLFPSHKIVSFPFSDNYFLVLLINSFETPFPSYLPSIAPLSRPHPFFSPSLCPPPSPPTSPLSLPLLIPSPLISLPSHSLSFFLSPPLSPSPFPLTLSPSHRRLGFPQISWVAIVRDPVERLISQFYYIRIESRYDTIK